MLTIKQINEDKEAVIRGLEKKKFTEARAAIDAVLAADGTTVGTPTTVNMRVRADWEGRGTGVIVGVLVAIVVTGTVRTVRRGRRTAVAPAAQETA